MLSPHFYTKNDHVFTRVASGQTWVKETVVSQECGGAPIIVEGEASLGIEVIQRAF
eukprot:COSAG06_NODE_295_length_18175_cov_9.088017_24_plen_56_part_00